MTTYTLNDSKMFMDIDDGIAIVINSDTGIYYGLNNFGTAVLEALAKGVDSDEVLKQAQALSGAPSDLSERFSKFVDQLLKDELLVEGPHNEVEVLFNLPAIADEQFEMTLQSYADAQEMLLADPIHEVKEATGWEPSKEAIGYSKEETKEREKKMEQ